MDRDVATEEIYDKTVYAMVSDPEHKDHQYCVFDRRTLERLQWEEHLVEHFEELMEQGAFVAWFQPQYSARTRKIVGAEALSRMVGPDGRMITPDRFIPILERNGKIIELDRYMFRQACRMQKKLGIPVSVNLSRANLYNDLLPEGCAEVAAEEGADPAMLPIEITETSALMSPIVRELTEGLVSRGFPLHMDDYGTGYSSLHSLYDLPFSTIKLDKSIVDIIGDEKGEILLRHTITFAKETGLTVVAEGVETMEQYLFLRALGCDAIQGYYFSRPVSGETLELMMREK